MANVSRKLFHSVFGPGYAPGIEGHQYCDPSNLAVLVALCRTFAPRAVVEIGVQRGATAKLLLDVSRTIRTYLGIDITPDARMPLPGQQSEVPPVNAAGELALPDPRFRLALRPRGSADLAPSDIGAADLVFIDGDHSAAAVRRDTALARAATALRGGIIVWHDYGNRTVEVTGVIDAINRDEGDRIVLVDGTWMCFELRAPDAPAVACSVASPLQAVPPGGIT